MRIPLDRQADIPLYQQIESYLRQAILSGNLSANMRLPAARQLAQDLGINRSTVENAYSALEADGLVFSRMGSGTYVLQQDILPSIPKQNTKTSLPLWQQNLHVQNSGSTSEI